MEYAYYVSVEVHTKSRLSEVQQDKLREAVLNVLDDADRDKKLPYVVDIPTAQIDGEERV